MKQSTLLGMLVDLTDEPAYALADEFGISAASLSRHCAGLLNRKSTLQKFSEFFSRKLGIDVDSNLLTMQLQPAALVELARYLRSKGLRGAA